MIGLPIAVVALIITTVVVVVRNTIEPVESAASSYYQALKDERYGAAYDMLCPHNTEDRDTFVQFWRNQSSTGKRITAFEIVGTNVETNNGRTTGHANVKLSYADGSKDTETLLLNKIGETWNPC